MKSRTLFAVVAFYAVQVVDNCLALSQECSALFEQQKAPRISDELSDMITYKYAGVGIPKGLSETHHNVDIAEYLPDSGSPSLGIEFRHIFASADDRETFYRAAKKAGISAKSLMLMGLAHGPHRVASFVIDNASLPDLKSRFEREFSLIKPGDHWVIDISPLKLREQVPIYRGTILSDSEISSLFSLDWDVYLRTPLRRDELADFVVVPFENFSLDPSVAVGFSIQANRGGFRVVIEAVVPGRALAVAHSNSLSMLGEAQVLAPKISPQELREVTFIYPDGTLVRVPWSLVQQRNFAAIRNIFVQNSVPPTQWPSVIQNLPE